MAKIALKVEHREMPRIREVILKFENGKVAHFPDGDTKIEKVGFMQWLGPDEPTLVMDIRLIFTAESVGVGLEAIDGR